MIFNNFDLPTFLYNSNYPIGCVGANDDAGTSGTTLNVPVPVSEVDWGSKTDTDTDTGAGVTSPLSPTVVGKGLVEQAPLY